MLWCRKCRRFSKTFFVEGEQGCSPESAKHRTSLGKSTDVFIEEVRCFCFPEREQSKLAPSYAKQATEEDEVKGSRRKLLTISEHGIQTSFPDSQKDLPDSDNTKC